MTDPPEVQVWRRLMAEECRPLRAAALATDARDVNAVARLRRAFDPTLAAVALQWAAAQTRAARKFPGREIAADVAGIEQASSLQVARHKARRFADAGAREIADLCCGIGGDAMALMEVGAVLAVDRAPLRAWMAGHNAGCATRVADVEADGPQHAWFHIDPDRRDRHQGGGAARRLWRLEDYRPGPAFLERLAEGRHGAVKLGPGVDPRALPHALQGEVEFISEDGDLVQAVAWCGRLARGAGVFTATLLPGGESLTGPRGGVDRHRGGVPGKYLHVPDPALERAGLVASLPQRDELAELWPGLGILGSDGEVRSPWLRTYEVVEVRPWRMPDLKAALRALGAGVVEVKTRGKAVDAEQAQRELRGDGERPFVVFGLRLDQRVVAILASHRA